MAVVAVADPIGGDKAGPSSHDLELGQVMALSLAASWAEDAPTSSLQGDYHRHQKAQERSRGCYFSPGSLHSAQGGNLNAAKALCVLRLASTPLRPKRNGEGRRQAQPGVPRFSCHPTIPSRLQPHAGGAGADACVVSRLLRSSCGATARTPHGASNRRLCHASGGSPEPAFGALADLRTSCDDAMADAAARPPAPSPTTTKGAQYAGCASCGSPWSIRISIARRKASARPTLGSRAISRMATVMSLTVASE